MSTSGQETILVVDDEPSLSSMLNALLSEYGYRLLQASSAEQALQLLQTNHVDLIISDIKMPGMDGDELAEQVQNLYPHIKLQLVSGYSDQIESDRVLHKRVLFKPYNTNEMLKRVQDLLAES